MIELTASQTDYLKAIYTIFVKEKVTVTKIAETLNCTKPSVIRALKNLDELKLIIYNHNGIILTDLGIRYAKNIIRRNNILERFFIDVLKIEENLAIKDAHNLKHGVSCYTINKLENYLFTLFGEEISDDNDYCVCEYKDTCNHCHDE